MSALLRVMSQLLVRFKEAEGAGIGLDTVLMNILLEFAVFLASDFVIRPCLRQHAGVGGAEVQARRRDDAVKPWLIQEAILLVSVVLLMLLHHIPYLLMFAMTAILVRVIHSKICNHLYAHQIVSVSSCTGPAVSRPLRNDLVSKAAPWTSREEDYSFQPALRLEDSAHVMPRSSISGSTTSTNTLHRRTLNSDVAYLNPSSTSSSFLKHSLHQNFGRSFGDPHPRNVYPVQPYSQAAKKESSSSHTTSISESSGSSSLKSSQHTVPMTVSDTSSTPYSIPRATSLLPYNLRSYSAGGGEGGGGAGLKSLYALPSTTPPGLFNEGNTCFINSTLQCLNWTPGFAKVLPQFTGERSDNSIFLEKLNNVLRLCKQLPDGKSIFNPVSTLELLSAISMLGCHLVVSPKSCQNQQDAAEFLLWLLNHLHATLHNQSRAETKAAYDEKQVLGMEEERRKCKVRISEIGSENTNSLCEPMNNLSGLDWELYWLDHASSLYELFMGQILEARKCQKCDKVTMNVEYFTLLPLALPVGTDPECTYSLDNCFDKFSQAEELVQDNMITCSCSAMGGDNPPLAPANRLALLSVLPKSLVIQLTRFSYSSILHSAVKNSTRLSFPTTIDLFHHTMAARLEPQCRHSMTYQLHAFCMHSGAQSTSFGHYVACCKAANGQWYHYNDDTVTHIEDIDSHLESDFVLRNTYLLFYSSLHVAS